MYQFPLVRRQENSSFANFSRVSACAICKCAVLCVGCSFFRFFLSLSSKLSAVSFFLGLLVTIVYTPYGGYFGITFTSSNF